MAIRWLCVLPGAVAAFAVVGLAAESQAHFILQSPPAMTEQNQLGDPQKAPPCGDDGSAVPTGVITTYQAGQTITLTIDERIPHPGHYRVALAINDPSELPEPPPVTVGDTPCGSAPIDPNPVFPVLADGLFVHTESFDGPQSIEITLPDDVSCTNCTLQVIEFMSNHALNDPGGCYYHHCAAIAIEAAEGGSTSDSGASDSSGGPEVTTGPSATTDADGSTSDDPTTATSAGSSGAGTSSTSAGSSGAASSTAATATATATATDSGEASDSESGCGCSAPGRENAPAALLLAFVGLLGLRARRRR